ncbi:MAG TPA: lysophospholipid acyltransferase family protein [Kofleriaceae bacterium]|nr:lysophospholipid acyltransferase family protein [Kofleriaceae bacterium]
MADAVVPPEATDDLTRIEKLAVRLARAANETDMGVQLQDKFLRTFTYSLVHACLANRTLYEGLDEVMALNPDRGVVFATNHRSFFDQFAVLLGLYLTGTPWCRIIRFPVRSNFFYERPLGMVINHGIAGGVMYPPIFRQAEKASFNKDAIDRLIKLLADPGVVIGVHPEGTRGKGADPYEMLPAQPGIGQIALNAKPIVLPVFIQGLSNNFAGDVVENYKPGIRQRRPIIVVMGKPVDYSALTTSKPRVTLYKKCADLIREKILELAPRERVLRAQCLSGELRDDDPRWIVNRRHSAVYAPVRG